ncbi:MAG: B12-binding domain-containing radical SAM protein [Flavobacteriaceae bacterium]|jgi:anaerobic magnesium-protoporphyrin IX monomethyl ester cyclase|nr:B12-binding domain-containing radical SAM protein [Nitrospina sp.]MBT7676571.1 B12-binding domain-containing radical SAM protein [Flavobacteriaceae bacterium]
MLLINPAYEHFGGMMSRYVPVGIPVALGVIAAYLKKWGVKNLQIVDEEIEEITPENYLKFIPNQDKQPIIGITVLTSQAGRAYAIAKLYKEAFPKSIIIMGGVHVTALPQEALQTGQADIVVRGEGEETMRKLYFAIQDNQEWKDISGISYLNNKGEVVDTPDGDLLQDIDEIPIFPYELFEHPKYDMGFITTARGCPYKCSYCSQRLLTGLTYRWHSKERVLENLKILVHKYHQTNITFYDDNFSTNKRRVIDLCDAIVKEGLHEKCSFAVQTRADNLYEDILPAMKRANFKTVALGMETGIERIAKEINKDQTVAIHLEKIALLKKYGIGVTLMMIYGFPTETPEERIETFRVIKNADVGFVKFNNLIPYPGTLIYENAKNAGKLHIEPGWRNFNSTLSITRSIFSKTPLPYVPDGTTEIELKMAIIKRNLLYYFQWKIIKKILTRDKGLGWVELPPMWYLRPREVFALLGMTLVCITNLLFSFSPAWAANLFSSFIKHDTALHPPKDIKAFSRIFKMKAAPSMEPKS